MEKNEKYAYMISFLILSLTFFRVLITWSLDALFVFLIIVGILPIFFVKYIEFRIIKNMEERFPDFLRDLAAAREAGMTLPYSLVHVSKLDYGFLTKEIKKIANQISWGLPLGKALENFAKRVKSKHIRRSVSIIIEADKSGGKITSILEAVANFSKTMRELEKEQIGILRSYTIIIYFAYIVFILIIVLLLKTLLSGLTQLGGVVNPVKTVEINKLLFRMTIIQGFFTGLVAGKVGEGSVVNGIKHSIILSMVGFLSFEFLVW